MIIFRELVGVMTWFGNIGLEWWNINGGFW